MTASTSTATDKTERTAHQPWRFDPARSSVGFRASTLFGLIPVKGKFTRYEGTLDLERDPAIELTIEAASVDTKLAFRDKHLRSADFFDVEQHPQVRFVSDAVELEGERMKVCGRMYAGAKSIPLKLDASLRRVGHELEVDASTTVEHRRLGMSHGLLGMIPPTSELAVHGRLVR